MSESEFGPRDEALAAQAEIETGMAWLGIGPFHAAIIRTDSGAMGTRLFEGHLAILSTRQFPVDPEVDNSPVYCPFCVRDQDKAHELSCPYLHSLRACGIAD